MELTEIDKGLATLIAASLAALVSLITLFITLYTNFRTEIRSARRKTLEEFIYDVSESIHQLVATSNILLKNKSEESRANWGEKADEAKETLKKLRPKLRYSLWGIDDQLRVLTRLPDYTRYTLESIDVAKKVVKRGSKLGDALDNCIRKCYLNGRSPRFYEIWKVTFLAWRCEKTRNDYKSIRDKKLAE